MALVSLDNLHFDYGRETILRGVTLALQTQVRCGLVGANGAGKTTLLAAIAGELDIPAGTRQIQGGVDIVMLRQETTLAVDDQPEARLLERVGVLAFHRERAIEQELADINQALAAEETDSRQHQQLIVRQGHLQAEFERLGGYGARARLESALMGVGLGPESWSRSLPQLSGGERRRAALAVVLLSGADLLLLDEPTNHLDLDSCEWLEGFLNSGRSAAVIVSHDRYFLDRVTTRTIHLDRGRLVSYSGNFSFFAEQSRQRYEQDFNAWQRQQTKIKQTEEYIRRNIEGQKTKQAQARRKQLAKEVRLERPSAQAGRFRFSLEPVRRSGGTVFQGEALAKRYGERALITDLDFHVARGEKIGIVGPNGCGKSTLLKILTGEVVPDSGRVVVGHGVDLGYYDQELSGVSDHNTVLGEISTVDPRATLGELRSFLGAFGFGEDLYDRSVARLSGGERGRLSLLRLVKEGHNTLLLDEPTNHLDVRSRESLEAALKEFEGTLIVVSHDRRFLDQVVQRLIIFPDARDEDRGCLKHFAGNYSQWMEHRRQKQQQGKERRIAAADKERRAGARSPAKAIVARARLSKNEIKRREQQITAAEIRIKELEAEQAAAVASMGLPATDNAERLLLAKRCSDIEEELTQCMERWEALHLEIEEGTDENP